MEALFNFPALTSVALWSRSALWVAAGVPPAFSVPERPENTAELEVANAFEAALVRSARGGDRNAFARLIDLHKQAVFALATRFVGTVDAPDMAQEAFLRAFERLPTFDARRPLRPWLLSIAYHRCIDELRRRRRAGAAAEAQAETEEASQPPPASALELREESARVAALLGELPDQQREALLLFHQEALSYRDIAGVLGVPLGTVMTWIHRARRTLRARLESTS